MLLAFLRFELRHRLRQPSVWVFAAIFALGCFGAITSNVVSLGGGTGRTAINAPYVIMEMLGNTSVFSAILVTAFVATAVTRDFELGTDGLFFSKPIRPRDYLLGRFLGAVSVSLVVMVGAAGGLMLGAAMPWHDPQQLVAFSVAPYAWALLVIVLPNLVVMGAFFFAIATLTRRVLPAYVGLLAFFMLYGIADAVTRDLHHPGAALVDPFGV